MNDLQVTYAHPAAALSQEEERKKAAARKRGEAAEKDGVHLDAAFGERAKNLEPNAAKETSFFGLLFGGVSESRALREAGLPPEIAGKTTEEALVFLKDNITMAGDVLAEKMTNKAYQDYRKAVKQFTKFVLKKSFDIAKKQATLGRRKRTVYTQVEIIDKKLNELAAQIFLNQKNKFAILAKTEEIAGLIVDMLF